MKKMKRINKIQMKFDELVYALLVLIAINNPNSKTITLFL